jgi:tetratricopeptide (TPR) repeat protein
MQKNKQAPSPLIPPIPVRKRIYRVGEGCLRAEVDEATTSHAGDKRRELAECFLGDCASMESSSRRRVLLLMAAIVAGFFISFADIRTARAFGWWGTGSNSEEAQNRNEYPDQLVEEGVASYERGDYSQAASKLKIAAEEWPDNSPAVLYLGLAYLQQGDAEDAISAWQKYTHITPSTRSERTSDLNQIVAENLTVLVRGQEQIMAKQAAAQERSIAPNGNIKDDAVAVTGLKNLGTPDLGPLGKGFAALLIADLSQVNGLVVVERQSLQTILNELKLGKSGAADPATAAKAGHLLGAGKIITGSYLNPSSEQLRIDCEAAVTANLKVLGNAQVSGPAQTFYVLEKQLAFAMLDALGYSRKNLTAAEVQAVNKPETRSLPAFTDFSQGLEAEDQNDYSAAQTYFQNALQLDPSFGLAKIENYFVHFHMSHHGAAHRQRMKSIADHIAKRAPSMGEMMAAMTVMKMNMRNSAYMKSARNGNGRRDHHRMDRNSEDNRHGGRFMGMGMNGAPEGMNNAGAMGMEPMGMGAGGVEGSAGMNGSGMRSGMGMSSGAGMGMGSSGMGMMHNGMMK